MKPISRRFRQPLHHRPGALPLAGEGRFIEDRHAGVQCRAERFLVRGVGHGDKDGVDRGAAQQFGGTREDSDFGAEFGADSLLRCGTGRGCRDDFGAPIAP